MIRPAVACAVFLVIFSVCKYSVAQSDPSLFNTVINVPPNSAPPQIGSNTQLNLKPGGMLNSITGGPNSTFDAGVRGAANVNVEVNISGGTGAGIYANAGGTINMSGGDIYLGPNIGYALLANTDSTLNMTGGRLLSSVGAFGGSTLNLSGGSVFSLKAEAGSVVQKSGGTVVRSLVALPGSDVELVGGEFRLDGLPYANATINLTEGTGIFTGTLADGSPFLLTRLNSDYLANVSLAHVPVAPADLKPIIVSSATAAPPAGLRTGQSLTLNSGKLRDGFQAYGAQMFVNGGNVGFATRVVDTKVDFNGGLVGRDFAAYANSVVKVAGGEVGPGFIADSATVSITSGKIDDSFFILHGSTASVSGGIVGRFVAVENSTLNISDGFVDSNLRALTGSVVNLSGGRIRDNSSAQAGSIFNITGGEIGTNFTTHTGSTVNISGGRLLGNATGFGGEVRIQGGEINVSGTAELGRTVMSASSGRVNVFGGTIGDNSWIAFGTMHLMGGSIGDSLQVNGTLNISGGAVGNELSVPQFGAVNLFMTQAFLNGAPIDAPLGMPIEIFARDNAVLSGTLLDGAALEFRINSVTGNAYFNPGATLTVTLVPEPSTLFMTAVLMSVFMRSRATTARRQSVRRKL